MIKLAHSALVILTLLLSMPLFAGSNCPGSRVALVFGNGMFNSEGSARSALRVLKRECRSPYERYELAYNTNESMLLELLQVFEQSAKSDERIVWSYFSRFSGPEWFNRMISNKMRSINRSNYVKDRDFRFQIALYRKLFADSDMRVEIVAHSQGNFYANAAYEYLKDNDHVEDKLRIVAVAEPDAYVAGGGEYRTLESDLVIRPIPTAPPFNISNFKHGYFDHAFVENYLHGDTSGSELLNLIEAEKSAGDKSGYLKDGYLDESLIKMKNWVAKLEASKRTQPLPKYQCLAVALFMKVENWFGVDCEKRSFTTIHDGALDCLDEWSNPNQVAYGCGLWGLDELMTSWHSAEDEILKDYPECMWNHRTLPQELTKDVLNQALDFIRDPEP